MSDHLIEHAGALLHEVRARAPRVHCLMNTVVQKLVADGLTAVGAIPSMTSSVEEVGDFASRADVLSINLGTLDAQRRQAIDIALDRIGKKAKPWVLDPAHCDYSPKRAALAQELLGRGASAIRANTAEITLLDVPDDVVGIHTGARDVVRLGAHRVEVGNGHAWMPKVTGTGCLSSAVIAAFLAVEADAFVASVSATLVMRVAAGIAGHSAKGPGSFEPALLDALANLDANQLSEQGQLCEQGRICDAEG